eukprot:3667673-Pyramimonas_sp.AAC.1
MNSASVLKREAAARLPLTAGGGLRAFSPEQNCTKSHRRRFSILVVEVIYCARKCGPARFPSSRAYQSA